MELIVVKLSQDLISTQNMNFECWPSILWAMDQRVPFLSREQMKMVRIPIDDTLIKHHRIKIIMFKTKSFARCYLNVMLTFL